MRAAVGEHLRDPAVGFRFRVACPCHPLDQAAARQPHRDPGRPVREARSAVIGSPAEREGVEVGIGFEQMRGERGDRRSPVSRDADVLGRPAIFTTGGHVGINPLVRRAAGDSGDRAVVNTVEDPALGQRVAAEGVLTWHKARLDVISARVGRRDELESAAVEQQRRAALLASERIGAGSRQFRVRKGGKHVRARVGDRPLFVVHHNPVVIGRSGFEALKEVGIGAVFDAPSEVDRRTRFARMGFAVAFSPPLNVVTGRQAVRIRGQVDRRLIRVDVADKRFAVVERWLRGGVEGFIRPKRGAEFVGCDQAVVVRFAVFEAVRNQCPSRCRNGQRSRRHGGHFNRVVRRFALEFIVAVGVLEVIVCREAFPFHRAVQGPAFQPRVCGVRVWTLVTASVVLNCLFALKLKPFSLATLKRYW